MGNQTSFKPGWKGGPGRPRKKTLRDVVREELWKEHPKYPEKVRIQVWGEMMIKEAESSNNLAKIEVLKWLDGASPPQVKGPDPEELDGAESIDEHGDPI